MKLKKLILASLMLLLPIACTGGDMSSSGSESASYSSSYSSSSSMSSSEEIPPAPEA